jgi:hypothetical protein
MSEKHQVQAQSGESVTWPKFEIGASHILILPLYYHYTNETAV